jgi:hypothetical protein
MAIIQSFWTTANAKAIGHINNVYTDINLSIVTKARNQ